MDKPVNQSSEVTETGSLTNFEPVTSLQSVTSKSHSRTESVTQTQLLDTVQIPISIDDLPNEVLDYIFSLLDFIQRIRVGLVCKRWHCIGVCPKKLTLNFDVLPNRRLDDEMLSCILTRCGPVLKELALKRNTVLTCESLDKLGQQCPNLVALELHLVGTSQIACMKTMAASCPNLKLVRLENEGNAPNPADLSPLEAHNPTNLLLFFDTYRKTYNEGLLAIAQSCEHLEHLHIYNLTLLNTRWIDAINPNLHTLCLYDTLLTFQGMQSIIRRCHELQEFVVDDCSLLDQSIVSEFLKHFRHSLRVLMIKWQGFDDMDWCIGFSGMINLEVLRLLHCNRLDDNLMKVLAKECSKLRLLDIGCSDVTDLGLINLERLPSLKELRIGPISKIEGFGLVWLVAKGILQQVTVSAENSNLQELCGSMAAMYPNVRFIVKEKERLVNEWWEEMDSNEDDAPLPEEFFYGTD